MTTLFRIVCLYFSLRLLRRGVQSPGMATDALPAASSDSAPMGEFSRVLGVFFEPTKTFTDVAERPRWLVPMLISIAAGLVLIYLFNSHVGWEPMLRRAFENSPRAQQLDPEQRQRALDLQLRIVPIFSYVGTIVGPALLYLIGGGIILGIVKGLLGVPMRFAQVFAVKIGR